MIKYNKITRLYILNSSFPGNHSKGEIPDTIPNSEVKPFYANGTRSERTRKSR